MIRGDPAPRPDWVTGPYAIATYEAAVAACEACPAIIEWGPLVAKGAGHMAMYCQCYLRLARDVRQNYPELTTQNQRLFLAEHRVLLRGMLADFLLLDREMVDAPGTIRPDGLDTDVARLCDIPPLQ